MKYFNLDEIKEELVKQLVNRINIKTNFDIKEDDVKYSINKAVNDFQNILTISLIDSDLCYIEDLNDEYIYSSNRVLSVSYNIVFWVNANRLVFLSNVIIIL